MQQFILFFILNLKAWLAGKLVNINLTQLPLTNTVYVFLRIVVMHRCCWVSLR